MLSSAGFASAALPGRVTVQPSLAQMAGSLETRTVNPPSSRSRDCDWHAARGWIHRAVQMLLALAVQYVTQYSLVLGHLRLRLSLRVLWSFLAKVGVQAASI